MALDAAQLEVEIGLARHAAPQSPSAPRLRQAASTGRRSTRSPTCSPSRNPMQPARALRQPRLARRGVEHPGAALRQAANSSSSVASVSVLARHISLNNPHAYSHLDAQQRRPRRHAASARKRFRCADAGTRPLDPHQCGCTFCRAPARRGRCRRRRAPSAPRRRDPRIARCSAPTGRPPSPAPPRQRAAGIRNRSEIMPPSPARRRRRRRASAGWRPPVSPAPRARNALSVTSSDEPDIAAAAISGVKWPEAASGSASRL